MAAPEEFIEIADFRPGIWSDMHAAARSSDFALPSVSTIEASTLQNGAATIENTYDCKVDRSGALVPLPFRLITFSPEIGHIPLDQYTTAHRPVDFPFAVLLDAEISPQRWYFETDTGNPLEAVYVTPREAFSVHTLWGFFHAPAGDGTTAGYFLYVLGREYRVGSIFEPVYDFAFSRSDSRYGNPGGGAGFDFLNFPAGSLCLSRFDHASKPANIEAFGVLFAIEATTPVMVGLISYRLNGNPYGMDTQTGAIPAAEQAFLTAYHPTAGSGATVKRPSTYTPTLVNSGDLPGRVGNAAIGMSIGTDGYDTGAAHPVDEWSWHHKDDAIDTLFQNMPFVPYLLIPHQGRVVMADQTGFRDWIISQEVDTTALSTDEWRMFFSDDILWYSRWGQPIGDVYTPVATELMRGYIPLQVAEDQVSQIGILGVVTADELLVVKARGGGALVRGDLDNPTVRRLPHIESTGGITSKGAQTPIGYIYGTRTGVFAFDGGDTTRKLSRQIDGFFWNPYEEEDLILEGSYGRFAYWNDMVFAPNNYVYDVETDSWWRLDNRLLVDDDPVTYVAWPRYNIYLISDAGRLFAFPYKCNETVADNSGQVYHVLDERFLATEYSWQSHSLVETRGRRVSFQDVRLVVTAAAAAQIRVTLTGYDEDGAQITSVSVMFTVTAASVNRPQILRKDIAPNFVAEYVNVRIEAMSGTFAAPDQGDPAPKIHAIRMGIRPRQTTPRAG